MERGQENWKGQNKSSVERKGKERKERGKSRTKGEKDKLKRRKGKL